MSKVIERLRAVRETITARQRDLDRLQGQRDALLKSLKDEFGLDTVEAAEAEADRLDKELEEQEKELEAGVTALEKELVQETSDGSR